MNKYKKMPRSERRSKEHQNRKQLHVHRALGFTLREGVLFSSLFTSPNDPRVTRIGTRLASVQGSGEWVQCFFVLVTTRCKSGSHTKAFVGDWFLHSKLRESGFGDSCKDTITPNQPTETGDLPDSHKKMKSSLNGPKPSR